MLGRLVKSQSLVLFNKEKGTFDKNLLVLFFCCQQSLVLFIKEKGMFDKNLLVSFFCCQKKISL